MGNLVTAKPAEVHSLKEQGYLCVGVYTDLAGLHKVLGLISDKGTKTHLAAKDYYACKLLVYDYLNKVGLQNFIKGLRDKCREAGVTRLALIAEDYGTFSFRHVVAMWMLDNDLEIVEYNTGERYDRFIGFIREQVEKDSYKNTGIEIIPDDELAALLEAHTFRFASTMASNPHYYTLRKTWDAKEWLKAYLNIREKGVPEIVWGKVYRVFYASNGWKYWTMPCGHHTGTRIADDIVLINRAKIK